VPPASGVYIIVAQWYAIYDILPYYIIHIRYVLTTRERPITLKKYSNRFSFINIIIIEIPVFVVYYIRPIDPMWILYDTQRFYIRTNTDLPLKYD